MTKPTKKSRSPIPERLKEARLIAGISQAKTGILAGLDPSVANVRINQYERGTHTPNYQFVLKLAEALNVPAAFFYAIDDDLASVISSFGRLSKQKKAKLLQVIKSL